jgi:hypothetical protein
MLVFAVFGGFTVLDASDTAVPMPVWFGMELPIGPDQDAAGVYRCTAQLTDLTSGEVLSAPTEVFPAGDEAKVTSQLPFGDALRARCSS